MGIFSKLFRKDEEIKPEQERALLGLSSCLPIHRLPAPNKFGEPSMVEVTLRVIQYTDADKNEQVRISMSGIGSMNVCLASFLTKGVSYAQEKFNEYQANKDTDAIVEEPKSERPRREIARPTQRDVGEMRAWAKAKQAKGESK